MTKGSQKEKENENRELYEHLKGRIKLMHQGLKSLYLGSDEASADVIHGVGRSLYYLEDIFFDLLFDEKSAKEVLIGRTRPF